MYHAFPHQKLSCSMSASFYDKVHRPLLLCILFLLCISLTVSHTHRRRVPLCNLYVTIPFELSTTLNVKFHAVYVYTSSPPVLQMLPLSHYVEATNSINALLPPEVFAAGQGSVQVAILPSPFSFADNAVSNNEVINKNANVHVVVPVTGAGVLFTAGTLVNDAR